jgi:hypothetical protein
MIPELFCLPPVAIALDPEAPPLPHWLSLSFAGAAALVTALLLSLA